MCEPYVPVRAVDRFCALQEKGKEAGARAGGLCGFLLVERFSLHALTGEGRKAQTVNRMMGHRVEKIEGGLRVSGENICKPRFGTVTIASFLFDPSAPGASHSVMASLCALSRPVGIRRQLSHG